MADPRHSKQLPIDGIHVVHAYEYANAAARNGAVGLLPADIGKMARQLDDNSFYILVDDSPVTWKSTSLELTSVPPQPLGFPAFAGTSDKASREDHVHEHGNLAGGSTHALATTVAAGYMSAADKTRFDIVLQVKDEGSTVASGQHTLNFLGSGVFASPGAPGEIDVTIPGSGTATITVKDEGGSLTPDKNTLNFVGPGITATTDTNPSQANVTITAAAPAATSLGAAPAEGVADTLARSDHVHQANTAPVNVTKASAAIGTSGEPARADHKHDVTTAAPVNVGDTNTEGASTSLARADHVHHAMYPAHVLGAGSIAATTTTRYLTPGFDSAAAPTAAVPYRVPAAGTLRRLRVRVNGTAGNGNAVVYTVRVNGAPTALTVSLASTSADGSDLSNTVAVAAGDLIDIEVTKALAIGAAISDVVASLEVFV